MLNMLEERIMVNPVNDLNNLKPIDAETRLKNKQDTQNAVADNSLADSVNLSLVSKQLEALKATLKDIPEINEARVLYFKTEIQLGNYQINSDKIAKNLLNMEIA